MKITTIVYKGYLIKPTYSGFFIVEKDNTVIFRPKTIKEAFKILDELLKEEKR